MNRRNFFKLAAATVAGFFLPRPKYHTGGVVEFKGPRHGGKTPQQKFDNLHSCGQCVIVFKDYQMTAKPIKVFLEENPDMVFDVIERHLKRV